MSTIPTAFKWIADLALATLATALGLAPAGAQAPPAWPPVPPEELALEDNAFDPGLPALILEYEVRTHNTKSAATTYKRIKIFREEGKKLADVEIRYFEKFTRVEEIRAHVTSPSGKSEDFNGAIYDKEVVRLRKFRFNAKTFTLPNVDVGSVIEYSYRLHSHSDIPDVIKNPGRYLITEAIAYPAAEWDIQQDTAVRHGLFTLHPIKGARTATFSHDLPKDAVKRTLPDGTVELEVNYISAFQKEEYSPPEENLKIRADVFYTLGMYGDPSFFWVSLARREAEYYEKFIGKPKDEHHETERLLTAGDSDETKLRKIYARVQEIRALSYEPERSKKERRQESLKENKNVQDVLNHGYAFANETNLVFIALARSAGFQAYPVRVASRNRAFFVPERLDPNQLNSLVVEVLIGSISRFLDPATPYCPDRYLPWEETDASGIRVDLQNNKIQKTPAPESKDAATRRHWLPHGGSVKLLAAESWTVSAAPLKAQFEIQVPNYASKAGQRLLVPVGILHSSSQHPFASTRRTHPVYFEYPMESYDEVKLELPPGMQIGSLPTDKKIERGGNTLYQSSAEKRGNALQLKRTLKMPLYYIPPERYLALRQFYEEIRTSDEQQTVLKLSLPGDKP